MNNQSGISIVLRNWQGQNAYFNGILAKISDEQLVKEVAPGKNTGTYLLGHMIAANESMLTLFGVGEKMYPELEKTFIMTPDQHGEDIFSAAELRVMWQKSSAALNAQIDSISPESWLDRHTAVSEEDFAKEPHRNQLNVLLTRMLHQSYHAGQLALLK